MALQDLYTFKYIIIIYIYIILTFLVIFYKHFQYFFNISIFYIQKSLI